MSIISISLYDCYDYIIGLSRTECTCDDPKGDFELDFNTSYSGLYMDELQPLSILNSLENCESDVWDIMNRARENAIKNFVSDGTRELLKHNKVRAQPYGGVVGRRTNTKDRSLTTTYAGVHLMCKRIVGGNITIKKFYTAFNFTGTVTVTVVDNLGVTHGTYVLNVTEDTWVENDISDLTLPLWNDLVDHVEYFIYYTRGANQPRNNDLCCNCHKSMLFSANRPYYLRGHNDAYRWAESVMVGGFDTGDISRFDDVTYNYGGGNYLNGLSFDVDVNCDLGKVLCKNSLNFESDPLAIATAYAVLYKAAEILADHIFAYPQMSYAKLVSRENLATEQASWIKKYQEMIEYIGLETDITKTDCLECKDDLKIEKGTIFS